MNFSHFWSMTLGRVCRNNSTIHFFLYLNSYYLTQYSVFTYSQATTGEPTCVSGWSKHLFLSLPSSGSRDDLRTWLPQCCQLSEELFGQSRRKIRPQKTKIRNLKFFWRNFLLKKHYFCLCEWANFLNFPRIRENMRRETIFLKFGPFSALLRPNNRPVGNTGLPALLLPTLSKRRTPQKLCPGKKRPWAGYLAFQVPLR
jgi:hypothetical protein